MEDTVLKIEGTRHAQGTALHIGRRSFRSNVLCAKHNSCLSPLDDEAIRLFQAFRTAHALMGKGHNAPPWGHTVNGRLLERWLAKTLANFVASGMFIGAPRVSQNGEVASKSFVRAIFGLDTFSGHAGAYVFEYVEERENWGDHYSFIPLVGENSKVGGMVFRFSALWFAFTLSSDSPPSPDLTPELLGESPLIPFPANVDLRPQHPGRFVISFL